jgi:hypothetical protein
MSIKHYISLFLKFFFLITEVTKFNPKRTGGLRAHWKRDNECERQGDGASGSCILGIERSQASFFLFYWALFSE